MKLIIQVPCYNEAQTLEIALNHLPKHIDGIDEIEYLIINDGSRDDTVKVAKNWGVNYVVNFRTNRGLAKGSWQGWMPACETVRISLSILMPMISTAEMTSKTGASDPGGKGRYCDR